LFPWGLLFFFVCSCSQASSEVAGILFLEVADSSEKTADGKRRESQQNLNDIF